jgi:hypothetical protein
MLGLNVHELIDVLHTAITQLQTEEQDTYLGWFLKRMHTNVRSIRILLDEKCDSDAHVIERVLLEHCSRVLYFKLNPPTTQDIQMFKSKHEPPASKIIHEHLGDSSIYMMLSAFTHTDSFSLSFEDDIQDIDNSDMAQAASEFMSWASVAVCLVLLSKAYPSIRELCEKAPINVHSALVSLGDSLVASAHFASESLDDEVRKVLPELMSWKIRPQVEEILSQMDKPSDIQDIIAKYVESVITTNSQRSPDET